jgi:NYN domain/OST-HTH/LOTUS domain
VTLAESTENRVAVYIDFDNIVISRYTQVHPKFRTDALRNFDGAAGELAERLGAATVDIGAILDYASSFGAIVISRAYADWSLPVNSRYQRELIARAVDLTQMFPTAGTKNGADIRLAVDVVEDLFRLPTITHVVIVAGDSDYISLAQRAKRLDRYVVGIGVAGSTSHSLADACNEFADYDDLPGVKVAVTVRPEIPPSVKAPAPTSKTPAITPIKVNRELQSQRDKATALLERALRLLHEKTDEEWLHNPAVKEQMKRMDPKFSEKALGYSAFTDFVKSRPKLVEVKEEGLSRMVRLKPASA